MTGRCASLLFLCECLNPSLDSVRVAALRAKISNNSVNWDRVILMANTQLVVTALWSALCSKNLQNLLPEEVGSYLSELHGLNYRRNEAIRKQTEEIIRNLNTVGLEPIVLKGAALMFKSAIEDPGVRFMLDIDIMVPVEQVNKTREIVSAIGYRSVERDDPAHEPTHHPATMVRDDEVAKVEIHIDLFHPFVDPPVLGKNEVWESSEQIRANGLTFRVLAPTHFVLHNVVHSESHHRGFALRKVPVRYLHDLTVFLPLYGAEVDWDAIDLVMGRYGLRRMMSSYLLMGSRLLGANVPTAMASSIGSWLHYAQCMIFASCPPDMEVWRTHVTKQVLSLCILFSSSRMQARFGCSDEWKDLTKTRLLYLAHLVRKYLFGPQRSILPDLLPGKDVSNAFKSALKEVTDETSGK